MQTLLVIEDELEITDYLKEYFTRRNVHLLHAPGGEEGLALLEKNHPDLLLLDLKLGSGISGIEVLRRVRAMKSPIPIIVVTAVDDPNVEILVHGLGATDYVLKPLKLEDIERVVLSRLKVSARNTPGTTAGSSPAA